MKLHAGLIIGLSFVLLAGCWDAGFITYDDGYHFSSNRSLMDASFAELFTFKNEAYFPITMLSYKLDLHLYKNWMPALLGSLAPGVRLMSCLYHAAAALVLWRLMLLLGLSRMAALFVAAAFAAHPMACETVCWISERKNTLSALFGFACLWTWLRYEGSPWRLPLTCGLLLLAYWSKAGALGVFPLLVLLDLFGGRSGAFARPDSTAGESRLASHTKARSASWLEKLVLLLPLLALTLFFVFLNVSGHSGMLIKPPGGTIFTALLTDLEILARYAFNMVLPLYLSFAYFVDPVRSVADPRVWQFGLLWAALIAGSIYVASNRRRAAFGWLWFFAALGPNLNLIAFFHLMQDRYAYLSTPGLFLVLAEVFTGIYKRLNSNGRSALRVSAVSYLALLAALSALRSPCWRSTLEIFKDAVEKQPKSAAARSELGICYAQAGHLARQRGLEEQHEYFRRKSIEEWKAGMDECPDVTRFPIYSVMAMQVGEYMMKSGRLDEAEHYWMMGAYPPPDVPDQSNARALALGYLASLRLQQNRFAEAYICATQAKKATNEDPTRLLLARAATALAEEQMRSGKTNEAKGLWEEARLELNSIRADSEIFPDVADLMKTLP